MENMNKNSLSVELVICLTKWKRYVHHPGPQLGRYHGGMHASECVCVSVGWNVRGCCVNGIILIYVSYLFESLDMVRPLQYHLLEPRNWTQIVYVNSTEMCLPGYEWN